MYDNELKTLASELPHDALIVGRGFKHENGAVHIDQSKVLGIDPGIVAEYAEHAAYDVMGQLFSIFPQSVQIISVEQYRQMDHGHAISTRGSSAGRKMADYLERYGVRHVMLTGVQSSYGLAWMTFYRKDASTPFTTQDAETAQYLCPALLFRWQRSAATPVPLTPAPSTLLPLTSRELTIAVLKCQGFFAKHIAEQLNLQKTTVDSALKDIRKKLHVSGRKMTVEDIKNYSSGL